VDSHVSVLKEEVVDILQIRPGGHYADLTFGEGGHTQAILSVPDTHVFALDRDWDTIQRNIPVSGPLTLKHGRFSQLEQLAKGMLFDGILMDLGPSTRQLLTAARGFSFSQEGPLDMRMDQREEKTLAHYLSQMNTEELAEALATNTDIKASRKLAKKILDAFQRNQISSTADLAATMRSGKHGGRHPATTLFLGLRMLVNDELREIEVGIPTALNHLRPGGRLAVISFHSTEDRLVKNLFKRFAGFCVCQQIICGCPRTEEVRIISKKPISAGLQELRHNPRARSAKLRCVEKHRSTA